MSPNDDEVGILWHGAHYGPRFAWPLATQRTHVELDFRVVILVVDAEGAVLGEDVQQLPLPLVHKDVFIEHHFLRRPDQGDVDVINCKVRDGEILKY